MKFPLQTQRLINHWCKTTWRHDQIHIYLFLWYIYIFLHIPFIVHYSSWICQKWTYYVMISKNGGTPKSSIWWYLHRKPSSYWGTPYKFRSFAVCRTKLQLESTTLYPGGTLRFTSIFFLRGNRRHHRGISEASEGILELRCFAWREIILITSYNPN